MDSLHRDISGTLRVISGYDEDEYSHLFFQSNDRLTDLFPKLDVYGKNVLTVLGSGDQALYFYKMGANCVDLFDINKLTFFYYYLRIWIIKYLNKSYPDYFLSLDLITNILKMVSPKSKEEEYAYSYWTMIVHMDIKDINQLFYIYFPIISQNFFLTKDVLNGIDRKFKFYNLNISSNINIDSKYDIIYTSNLSEYLYKKNVALERYKDNLIHLLSPGGLIVSTNMIDDDISLLEEEIFKSDFQIDRIFNDNEEQIAYTYKLK